MFFRKTNLGIEKNLDWKVKKEPEGSYIHNMFEDLVFFKTEMADDIWQKDGISKQERDTPRRPKDLARAHLGQK